MDSSEAALASPLSHQGRGSIPSQVCWITWAMALTMVCRLHDEHPIPCPKPFSNTLISQFQVIWTLILRRHVSIPSFYAMVIRVLLARSLKTGSKRGLETLLIKELNWECRCWTGRAVRAPLGASLCSGTRHREVSQSHWLAFAVEVFCEDTSPFWNQTSKVTNRQVWTNFYRVEVPNYPCC